MAITKKKNCTYPLDEKTLARLEREALQTLKGKISGFCKKRASESRKEGQDGTEKEAETKESKEIVKPTGYKCAKALILKTLRSIKEKQRREAFTNQYKRWKFYTSLIKLKTNLLNQKWDYCCHLKERTIIRESKRLETIERLRWEYNVDATVPPDSIIFDKVSFYSYVDNF
nr:PREDICTED: uncharacterized protein LOC105662398 [Megachile rotundata]